MIETVSIDYGKLELLLLKQGFNFSQASKHMGYCPGYLTNAKRKDNMSKTAYIALQAIFSIDGKEILKEQEKPVKTENTQPDGVLDAIREQTAEIKAQTAEIKALTEELHHFAVSVGKWEKLWENKSRYGHL